MHPDNYIHYPHIPYWNESKVTQEEWLWRMEKSLKKNPKAPLSLYVHLPFCESLCTHCSFSPYITKDHGVESKYIDALIREWWMYLDVFKKRPVVNEIYIGGGTPTFFSAKKLDELVRRIKNGIHLHPEASLTFEAHFSKTREEHIEVFRRHGFNTVRLGAAGMNKKTGKAINRENNKETLEGIVKKARFLGIKNIHLDLVYGLPHQSRKSIMQAAYSMMKFKPERISFYPYTHKPSCFPAQKKLSNDIPFEVEVSAFEEIGMSIFKKHGYQQIGSDLFVLKSDRLYGSFRKKQLKKRLFAYSPFSNPLCIGLGAGAISECGINYVKNALLPESYKNLIKNRTFAYSLGYFPYRKDEILIKHLSNLLNKQETKFKGSEFGRLVNGNASALEKMQKKRWLNFSEHEIKVKTKGLENFAQILKALDNRKPEQTAR